MHVAFGLRCGTLALLCAGYAGGALGGAGDYAPAGSATSGFAEPSSVIAMVPDSLRVRLDVPGEVRLGQAVPIAIRLENGGEQPLDLYLRGRTIAFDIFITRADGQVVWQRLKDEIIPAIIQLKVLRPGQVLQLKDQWHQRDNRGKPVAPGSYLVRGSVLTDGPAALETPRASLRIVPS